MGFRRSAACHQRDGWVHLEGRLANEVPPGQVLDAVGVAVVRDPEETPYLQDSSHPMLNRLLVEV